MKIGDMAGAQKTLASAQKVAELIQPENFSKHSIQEAIARSQIEAGDIAGAQKSADLIQDTASKKRLQEKIAEAQTKTGTTNAPTRQSTSDTQPPIQPVTTVSDWLNKLDDDDLTHILCPLNTGPFLDLAGYLKSLPASDDPEKVFDGLRETAEKIVEAQNVIAGMLKQQAGK